MKAVLIGMRGSGKSTVGKILAKALKCTFWETDKEIEDRLTMTVKDIIKKKGLHFFRDAESRVVMNLAKKDKCVIATGGGVIENENNMVLLKKQGFIIYLKTMPETAAARLIEDTNRPILTEASSMLEDLENLYLKRKEVYEKWSDMTVPTDNKSFGEVAKAVIRKLPKNL